MSGLLLGPIPEEFRDLKISNPHADSGIFGIRPSKKLCLQGVSVLMNSTNFKYQVGRNAVEQAHMQGKGVHCRR